MSARFVVVWAIALAGTWAVAGPAAALPPGVFVDPGSPAGKEYTIPLSALRGEASGHPAARDQVEPLFGIGITPVGASVGSASSAAQSRGSTAAGRSAHGSRGARVAGSGPGSRLAPPVVAGITDHGSPTPAVLLLAGLVVLGGLGLGGLALMTRRHLE